MKLQRLELNAFRAATKPFTVHFDPAKKLTMIFGENGTGKSTIADALTCLCTDGIGSLDDKSGVDKSFLTSANCRPSDLSIRLVTDAGEFSTRLSGSKFAKDNSKVYPTLRHLRRHQIAQLSEATASKRYEVLESYIDVELILKSEDGLRSLVNHQKTELEREIRSYTTAQTTLEEAWKKEGNPGVGGWKDWADEESGKDRGEVQGKITAIRKVLTTWQSALGRWQDVQNQNQDCYEAKQEVENAQLAFDRLSSSHVSVSQELLKLLEQANTFLAHQTGLHQCPLCEKPIEQTALIDLVQRQMDSMKEQQAAMAKLEAAKKTAASTNDLLQSLQTKLAEQLLQLETATTEYAGKPVSFGATAEDRLLFFEEKQANLNTKMNQLEQEQQAHEQTISQHNLIKSQYDAIIKGEIKTNELQALLDAAQAAFSIVETTRKTYQQAELSSISSDVDAMYQALHPDEEIGQVRLVMNPKTKKSVDLVARFLHHDTVAPQSVYSESHLDTLSICILLALAKKYSHHDSILLLDDVVTSVDETHLERFVNLLHDQQSHFAHIIVTTHHRPWRDRYRYHRYPESQVHFVELRHWELNEGLRQQRGKSQIEELREVMANQHFDRQLIAAKAGVLLENLLDFLTLTYACRLRRKPKQDYTLGELLDAVMAQLGKTLRVELLAKNGAGRYDPALPTQAVALSPHFEELKKLAFIRDQVGAHFNPLGPEVSDTDIFAFGNHTLALAEHLTCPDTGVFPDRIGSGEYWETRLKSVRLFPLREPS